MRALLLFLTVWISFVGFGQPDTAAIQQAARKVPPRERKDPVRLAHYLTDAYSDEASKVIAITYWIGNNIRYDYKAFVRRGVNAPSLRRILRKRKAVCEGYARLFDELCKQSGIRSATVNGHIHEWDHFHDDTIFRDEHAWSAVEINGSWHLMDITWGSGYIGQRRQYFRRLLFQLFLIPYKQKFRFFQHYDPKWFFVDPRRMVLSHQPNIAAFQLLREPIPIDTFENGGAAISTYTALYPETARSSSGTADYLIRDQLQQWQLEGDEGLHNNPNNHRVRGFNYFLIADSLHSRWYSKESKLLKADTTDLIAMAHPIAISDSMFQLNRLDNNREYAIKKRRSETWRGQRIEIDNSYLRALIDRRASNRKLIRSVPKIRRDNQRLASMQERLSKHYGPMYIRRFQRPQKEKKGQEERIFSYLAASDSLWNLAQSLIVRKDSLFGAYTPADIPICYEREAPMPDLFVSQMLYLKSLLVELKRHPIMIHATDMYIVKPDYLDHLHFSDSVYNHSTKPFYEQLVSNQAEILQLMRRYDVLVGQSLNYLASVKTLSSDDCSEDSIYAAHVAVYRQEAERLKPQIQAYRFDLRDFNKLLSEENTRLNRIKPLLHRDKKLELIRHKSYMSYRRYMRDAENGRAVYFRKSLRGYESLRKKSIRARRRESAL